MLRGTPRQKLFLSNGVLTVFFIILLGLCIYFKTTSSKDEKLDISVAVEVLQQEDNKEALKKILIAFNSQKDVLSQLPYYGILVFGGFTIFGIWNLYATLKVRNNK